MNLLTTDFEYRQAAVVGILDVGVMSGAIHGNSPRRKGITERMSFIVGNCTGGLDNEEKAKNMKKRFAHEKRKIISQHIQRSTWSETANFKFKHCLVTVRRLPDPQIRP
ncbi:hypothetical protein Pcinc_007859 [Petrolisthes cinctipes]|uniref:Uncharacterized protein n=1 Tax=Petrolisthes cinctipes TaxID=88211 RepID=A0AAE1KX10_PETCI|nr:hypothetical protein Pcinc_007859 [Petrolisthes cinctipes]